MSLFEDVDDEELAAANLGQLLFSSKKLKVSAESPNMEQSVMFTAS